MNKKFLRGAAQAASLLSVVFLFVAAACKAGFGPDEWGVVAFGGTLICSAAAFWLYRKSKE